jgi:integrase
VAGRKSSIRYYASKNGYFTIHRGQTHRLATGPDDAPTGPTFLTALDEFREIMQLANAPNAGDENTLRVISEMYLRHLAATKKPDTVEIRRQSLSPFLEYADDGRKTGEMQVSELKKAHVKAFIAYMREPRPHRRCKRRAVRWRNGSVRNFVDSLHACLNWAVKEELITINPIWGLEKPSPRSRGGECRVTPEMHRRALAASREDFRQLLVVLEATGCRPSELFNAEARHFDEKLGAIVYRGRAHLEEGEVSHKTSNKDKDRIIFLTGEALEVVKKLVALHPEGPLFRTGRSQGCRPGGWNQMKIQRRIEQLREKAALPPTFTLYSYRHEAHTAYLEAGGGIEDLAAIMGNTPQVIRRHYSHLTDNPQRLRRLTEEFRAKMAERANPTRAAEGRNETPTGTDEAGGAAVV